MLQDTAARRKAAREIARDAMRGDDADALAELDPLAHQFFGHAGVHLYVPVADEVACRRALLIMRGGIDELIVQMDRLSSRRSKSLLAHTVLQRWSQEFKRMVNGKRKSSQVLD